MYNVHGVFKVPVQCTMYMVYLRKDVVKYKENISLDIPFLF